MAQAETLFTLLALCARAHGYPSQQAELQRISSALSDWDDSRRWRRRTVSCHHLAGITGLAPTIITSLRSEEGCWPFPKPYPPPKNQHEPQIYSYLRYVDQNERSILVVLNFSDQELQAEIPLPEAFSDIGQAGSLKDLLRDETVALKGGQALSVPMPA
jgi:hypothetical protein